MRYRLENTFGFYLYTSGSIPGNLPLWRPSSGFATCEDDVWHVLEERFILDFLHLCPSTVPLTSLAVADFAQPKSAS